MLYKKQKEGRGEGGVRHSTPNSDKVKMKILKQ